MKGKWLVLMAAAVFLVCFLLPQPALAAADSGTCGADLTWALDEEGVLTVSGTGAMTDYAAKKAPWYAKRTSIQKILLEPGVTTIGNNAFYGCAAAEKVNIPSGVTAIGEQAFYNCTGLAEVTLPQELTHLGSYAFYKCTNLKSVNLPEGLPQINHYTFYGCTSLAGITIPEGVVTVGGYSFFNCKSLESIVIPTSVERILSDAFSGCEKLREVTIPQTIQGLGTRAFNRCNQLQDVYYGGSFVQWLSLDAANRPKATFIHYSCPDPAGHWFADAKPSSCTASGYERMACSCGYTKDEIPIPTQHSYASGLCTSCGAPEGLEFSVAFWSEGGEITVTRYTGTADTLVIPAAIGTYPVTEIGTSAFESCGNLVTVTLPDSIKNIRDRAFCNCTALQEINIPDSTVNIGSDAFNGCSGLTAVAMPAGLLNIGSGAFAQCAGLTFVTLPDSIAGIGSQAFDGCKKISDVYYGGTPDTWNSLLGKPSAQYVHYTCTIPEGHWVTEPLSATCETGASICTSCSCGYAEYEYFTEPLGHTEVTDPAVEATCAAPGKTEGKHCSVCNTVIVAQQNIPALSHTYDNGLDGTCNGCGIHRESVETRQVVHMFRMYNPNTGEHFYTGSTVERDNLVAVGWQYEGVGFTFPANTGLPVYRLFQSSTGEHLYTMREEEKDKLMAEGWNYEGIAFNSAYDTEAAQHRLHNPNADVGAYHFTFSQEEMNNLIAAGWEYQGIGWYSCWK